MRSRLGGNFTVYQLGALYCVNIRREFGGFSTLPVDYNLITACYIISRLLGLSEAKWVKSEVVNSCVRTEADPLGGPEFESEVVQVFFTFYTSDRYVRPERTFSSITQLYN